MHKTKLTEFKNFLFDWDGTLVDSSPLHDRAFREVLKKHLPEQLPHFNYHEQKGKTTFAVFSSLGVQDSLEAQALTTEKQSLYRSYVAQGDLFIFPYAKETLELLQDNGKQLFIVTGSSKNSVHAGLKILHLDKYFSGLICAEDVVAGKPSPECYLQCLKQHNLSWAESIAIEDAEAGIVAAQKSQLPVIGMHNELLMPSCDFLFTDFQTLHARIKDEFASK